MTLSGVSLHNVTFSPSSKEIIFNALFIFMGGTKAFCKMTLGKLKLWQNDILQNNYGHDSSQGTLEEGEGSVQLTSLY